MSLICWNCRGLGNPRAVGHLRELRRSKRPRMLFLSETLLNREGMETIRRKLSYGSCFAVDNRGHSGGLALLWDDCVTVTLLSFSNNHIDVVVENWGDDKWRFTEIYGFPESNNKRATWNLMRSLYVQATYPWCMGGDFNCMLRRDEKCGGVPVPDSVLQGFRDAVSDCHLSDLRVSGFKYTWRRARTREKLDRLMGNQQWFNLFPMYGAEVLAHGSSDHSPLLLILKIAEWREKRSRFHFEDLWVSKPSCKQVVEDSWISGHSTDPITDLMIVTGRCEAALRIWSRKEVGDTPRKI